MLKEISIEILRRCPNKCVHCSSNANINCTEIITYDKFCNIVKGAIKLGLKTVCFSGGEPVLHPQFIDMVNFVYKHNLECYIYTSGIYINEHKIKTSIPFEILNKIKNKITKMIFNIEASNESTYNNIMGTIDCFEKMKDSVKLANKLGIITEAHFVPMKLNINEIESTIQMCSDLGVSKISFLRLVNHGRAQFNIKELELSEEENQQLKIKLQELSLKNNSINIRIGVPLSESGNKYKCEAANGKLNIKYDGCVYPCEVFKNHKVKFINGHKADNINEKSIEQIYNHSDYLCTVRDYINNFEGIKTCENCIGQYYINNISIREV